MISNKNVIIYEVLDRVELYKFDIKFIFIRLHLKKLLIYLCSIYFKGESTAFENRFLGTVDFTYSQKWLA